MPLRVLIPLLVACLLPAAARAQEPMADCGNDWRQLSDRRTQVGPNHFRLSGNVHIRCRDMTFDADEVELFTDEHRVTAAGNVVFMQRGSQIAADRMEFDTRTRTGTFYRAWGTALVTENADRSMFGTQEPLAFFEGEEIRKVGERRYKITRGRFTTCVQPTPRWEIVSTTATIELDEYALLTHSVFRVKGVPLLYLPVFYYPIQEDDRATGFLIPTYGRSTYRGQTVSNAFFWAVNRSQDATFFHDWFSRTGQGYGSEYRYVAGPASRGDARVYFLREHEATFGQRTTPARRSHEIKANASQTLGAGFTARGRVSYFSNIAAQQIYHMNIYDASLRQRSYGGSVLGAWGAHTLTGTYDRSEVFYPQGDSTVYGSAPRVSFGQGQRQIAGLPVYGNYSVDFSRLVREGRSGTSVSDIGLDRFDVNSALRVPFTRWPFLSVSSYIGYRATHFSESLTDSGQQPEPLWRRFFDLRTEVVGPVLVRIWNTPGSGYAEKVKHVIEPRVELRRVTAIDVVDRIVKLEGVDYTVGGSTEMRYGVTNRILAKRRQPGAPAVSREILTVSVFQTYYTDEEASQIDYNYSTSFLGRPPSHFSPIAIAVSTTPFSRTTGSVRLEYDREITALQSISANGSAGIGALVNVSGGYSRRRLSVDSLRLDNFINLGGSVRTPGNAAGGSYSFNYDLGRSQLLQQRVTGYYNTQCCGFAAEYQVFNYPQFGSAFVIPQDRRFSLGFTLAGVGTFSNLLGMFGGGVGRQ